MSINTGTKVTGLLGYPVEHSLSPNMHNAAFNACGLNYCYLSFPVHPDSLTRAVEGVRALGFRGVNVTVPHKEAVLLSLDDIDTEAEFIGAVNTVVNDRGVLKGYNTDGRGFIRSLEENDIYYDGKDVFIVGAGGASRAISYYLSQKAANIYLYDLDTKKAELLAHDLKTVSSSVHHVNSTDMMNSSHILINATPLGLKPEDQLPFDTNCLSTSQVVIDLIYWDTTLVQSAREHGCTALNGLGMLLWQGVLAFELWTGIDAPVEIMKNALLDGLSKK